MNSFTATLHYIHDPMCSWCWAYRPVLQTLKQSLPESMQLVSYVGGLAADSDQTMPLPMQQQIRSTWQKIQQQLPQTRFNFDFWENNTPRRSTYPACRAVLSARQLADREQAMNEAIQHSYYLQAKNPSDEEVLIECAVSIGLDEKSFVHCLHSETLEHYFQAELQQVRSMGVSSFPSLVLQQGDNWFDVPIDYQDAHSQLQMVVELLDTPLKVQSAHERRS